MIRIKISIAIVIATAFFRAGSDANRYPKLGASAGTLMLRVFRFCNADLYQMRIVPGPKSRKPTCSCPGFKGPAKAIYDPVQRSSSKGARGQPTDGGQNGVRQDQEGPEDLPILKTKE